MHTAINTFTIAIATASINFIFVILFLIVVRDYVVVFFYSQADKHHDRKIKLFNVNKENIIYHIYKYMLYTALVTHTYTYTHIHVYVYTYAHLIG